MFFKQILFSFLLSLTFVASRAQVMFSPKVIPANGGLSIGGSTMLSWTVGETATLTFQSDSILLTQGFQQVYPSIALTGVSVYNTNDEIMLFPNPTNGILNIENAPTGAVLNVVNTIGMIILQQRSSTNTQINISDLPSGIYLIYVQKNGVNMKVFKVVKE